MASPFPGMDPYLEQPGVWPGFHGQALAAVVAHLVPQVTQPYVVQMEEQLFIHELPAEERRYLRPGRRRRRHRTRARLTEPNRLGRHCRSRRGPASRRGRRAATVC